MDLLEIKHSQLVGQAAVRKIWVQGLSQCFVSHLEITSQRLLRKTIEEFLSKINGRALEAAPCTALRVWSLLNFGRTRTKTGSTAVALDSDQLACITGLQLSQYWISLEVIVTTVNWFLCANEISMDFVLQTKAPRIKCLNLRWSLSNKKVLEQICLAATYVENSVPCRAANLDLRLDHEDDFCSDSNWRV